MRANESAETKPYAEVLNINLLEKKQKLDPIIQSIINYVENNTLPDDEKLARQLVLQADNFAYINNLLYHIQKRRKQTSDTANLQLYIPLNLRQPILVAHPDDLSHTATQNTYSLITKRFYWQGMYRDVLDYVQSCTTCIQHKQKYTRDRALLGTAPIQKPSLERGTSIWLVLMCVVKTIMCTCLFVFLNILKLYLYQTLLHIL